MRIAGFTVQYSRDHQYSRFFVRDSGYPVSFNWTYLGSEAGKPDMSTVRVQQDTLSGATVDDLVRRLRLSFPSSRGCSGSSFGHACPGY